MLDALLQRTALHFTSLHDTSRHFTTLHDTSRHFTTLHYTTTISCHVKSVVKFDPKFIIASRAR